jgi:[ribosomal protein S5]-alanine N-acetyltransferase
VLRLETPRLILRRPRLADAPTIEAIASRREVAEMTSSVPHPYPSGGAAEFITGLERAAAEGRDYHVVFERRADAAVIGMAALFPERDAPSGQIGYYVAPWVWGQGFATEAAGRLVRYALDNLVMPSLSAHVFIGNDASMRVLAKLGFAPTGEIERDLPLRGGLRRIAVFERRG